MEGAGLRAGPRVRAAGGRFEPVGESFLRAPQHLEAAGHRADGHHLIYFFALQNLLEDIGDKPVVTVGAVVGTHSQIMAGCFHMVFHDQ